ncbi:MAG: NusG domain II-containing protein [Clostridiales bacterium]|jgi:hypothetical protein|nr:NusG domain II-containing protein [Clostridiales bacterium]
MFFKKSDFMSIAAIIAVSAAVWAARAAYNGALPGASAKAEIYYEAELVETVALNVGGDRTFSIPRHENVVFRLYGDGSICFAQSDCPDKICVHSGRLRHAGESAACLPNKLILKIVTE